MWLRFGLDESFLNLLNVAALWLGQEFLEFCKNWKSVILGVWAALGTPETLAKGGGVRPPPFGRVSKAPGAAQTPKMADFQSFSNSGFDL
jgi:hypothetical protein